MSRAGMKLSRVLRVRGIQEQLARLRWAQALDQAERARQRVRGAQVELASAMEGLRAAQSRACIDAGRIVAAQQGVEALERRRGVLEKAAADLERLAEAEHGRWRRARMDRSALERLEERVLRSRRVSQDQREAKALDQAALERFSARPGPADPEAPSSALAAPSPEAPLPDPS
jgi:flagellar export protein FliJ